jgi:hypothetical protein
VPLVGRLVAHYAAARGADFTAESEEVAQRFATSGAAAGGAAGRGL